MPVKTVTITEEAYEALKYLKQENESFSKTILRVTGKKPLTNFFGILSKAEGKDMRANLRKQRAEDAALDEERERTLWKS